MSVSMMYEPTNLTKQVESHVTSADVEAMRNTFGSDPWVLGSDEVLQLQAMHAVAMAGQRYGKTIFGELADLVHTHEVIRVRLEY